MATKKPWLKTRLRQLGKTSAGMARHLKVEGPRIYEVIGGRRMFQPDEIEPAAKFLEWTVDELIQRLPASERVMKLPGKMTLSHHEVFPELSSDAVGKMAIPLLNAEGETKSYVSASFEGRSDLFCVYVTGRSMMPWRGDGQVVFGERHRPPRENDHVVIFMTVNKQKTFRVCQLLQNDNAETVIVKHHNPDSGPEPIERKSITSMCRVLTFDDIIR